MKKRFKCLILDITIFISYKSVKRNRITKYMYTRKFTVFFRFDRKMFCNNLKFMCVDEIIIL